MDTNRIGLGSLSEEEIRTQTRTEGHPREDLGRRQLSTCPGERPQDAPTLPTWILD